MSGKRVGSPAALALLAAVLGGGCYSDSPLDPTPEVSRDPRLIGSWNCVTADPAYPPEVGRATLAATPATEREYRLTWQEGDKEPESYRAFISLVGGSRFLNIRPLEENKHTGWSFFRYAFPRSNVIDVEMARADPFEIKGSSATPKAARATLEKALHSLPAAMQDFCVCIRTEGKGAAAPD